MNNREVFQVLQRLCHNWVPLVCPRSVSLTIARRLTTRPGPRLTHRGFTQCQVHLNTTVKGGQVLLSERQGMMLPEVGGATAQPSSTCWRHRNIQMLGVMEVETRVSSNLSLGSSKQYEERTWWESEDSQEGHSTDEPATVKWKEGRGRPAQWPRHTHPAQVHEGPASRRPLMLGNNAKCHLTYTWFGWNLGITFPNLRRFPYAHCLI